MSIRFKVILPYLLLTIIVAVTGAYVVTRLVSGSLDERLANQLIEAGHVISDTMARQEIEHFKAARLIAFTRGLGNAVLAGEPDRVAELAVPVAGGLNVESLMLFDSQGREALHLLKQSNATIMDVSQPGRSSTLSIIEKILTDNNPDSLPRRELAHDPVDGRYYYFTTVPLVVESQVVGAVVVGTSLDTLTIQLKNTSLADVIIYGENGQAIASSVGGEGSEALFLRTISISPVLYRDILTQNNTVHGENLPADGRTYSLARGPLKVGGDSIAVFAVVLPRDYVVQAGFINRDTYVILYSIAMLAVVLIGYYVARLIINPLSKLVRTSRAIASGDLTKRTEIASKDEIGVLANTFDEMTEHLQQRTLELEKTNRILEQMDQAKTRFIQITAHELRTPLTLIQGYAQILQVKAKGMADFTKYSGGIVEGSSRMAEIIDSMLYISRIDTNQLDLMSSETDIPLMIEKVEKTFQAALQERGVSLTTTGLGGLPVILADKDLLYKVFYHVIGNAIKYTPDGGRVTVSGQFVGDEPQDEIEIAVCDTGIGIDPENQELVFEKFYQTGEVLLHSSGKTKFKGGGPGLGLAIARGIVNAHRGRIWLESPGYDEATNPGTTVFVRLPVRGPDHEGR
jgi:signal transduction histidine kinase